MTRILWLALAMAAQPALAQPSVPWMPSLAARHAIELLVDEAGLGLTTSHWPLPQAAVADALDALPAELPAALDDARDRVRRELRAQDGGRAEIAVRNRGDALAGFGDDATPGSYAALRAPAMRAPSWALQFGGRVETHADADRHEADLRLDDSAVATEALGVQFQAWSHRSWWSPGWQSALALSNNAPAFNAIGVQRASASRSASPWLAWMGPWNLEAFIARTEDVTDPKDPYLFGSRLTFRPFAHVEFALTRMAQWGGEGRPQSARSFFKMLGGLDGNGDTPAQVADDPSNSLAGFDARLRCPSDLRCAVYGQLIGEDEAGQLPSKNLGLYGMSFWSADGARRLFAEVAETGCRMPVGRAGDKGCAYRNHAYPQGYASAGRWIGAGAGPDSRLLTLGWLDSSRDLALRLQWGRIGSRVGSYSAEVDDGRWSGRVLGIQARRDFNWRGATVTPQIDWLRTHAPDGRRTQARIGFTLSLDLDAP